LSSPAATISQGGFHNDHLDESRNRLVTGSSYRDLSTAILIPTRGSIPARVVNSWWGLMPPMNQPVYRIVVENMEVAEAYNEGIRLIQNEPTIGRAKFILTLEEDNIPPPDGHIKLAGEMYSSPYAAIGGLYWTKGEGGMPMIYGDPEKEGFEPCQVKSPSGVQECRGVAMGFTLWDAEIFRDPRLQYAHAGTDHRKWFRTLQEYEEYKGVKAGTQDLEFCGRAQKLGYRFAVDTRVLVGHFDAALGQTW
jgi:hypothetical protein